MIVIIDWRDKIFIEMKCERNIKPAENIIQIFLKVGFQQIFKYFDRFILLFA